MREMDIADGLPRRLASLDTNAAAEQTALSSPGETSPATVPLSPGAPVPLAPGRYLGRYRILGELGRGGMGIVYLAQDTELNRRVALKVPHLEGDRGGSGERFLQEARSAAALLHHRNICPIFDIGQVDGIRFLAMAYIEGRSLADELRVQGPLIDLRAAGLVRALALALETAHARGVVHRDVKPSNILIDSEGEPVLTDFGLARQTSPAQSGEEGRLTLQGVVLGTPAFMAPEQAEGLSDQGPAVDVYALGTVLYQCLCGQPPFEGSAQRILAQVISSAPAAVESLCPDVHPCLAAVCRQAMAKDPADRYPSMARFAAALNEAIEAIEQRQEAKTLRFEVAEEERRPRKRPRAAKQRSLVRLAALAGGLAALLLPLAVVGVIFFANRNELERLAAPDPDDASAVTHAPAQVNPAVPVMPKGDLPKQPKTADPLAGWIRFAIPGTTSSIALPGEPSAQAFTTKTEKGDVEGHAWSISQGHLQYIVNSFLLPGVVPVGEQIDAALDGGIDGLLKAQPGAEVLRRQGGTWSGCPGREVELLLADKQSMLHVRSILDRQRMHIFMVWSPVTKTPPPEIAAFFASWRR
jgi:hypothetical protein